jgi:lipoprotein signal peptidase
VPISPAILILFFITWLVVKTLITLWIVLSYWPYKIYRKKQIVKRAPLIAANHGVEFGMLSLKEKPVSFYNYAWRHYNAFNYQKEKLSNA